MSLFDDLYYGKTNHIAHENNLRITTISTVIIDNRSAFCYDKIR